MRVAVFQGVGKPVVIETRPEPVPAAGQAVIRVGRCGICGTDVTTTSGHGCYTLSPGALLGHEFAGEVVAVGKDVERLKVGDRITSMPVLGCGTCPACIQGRPTFCGAAKLYSGGFGEYVAVGDRESIVLPASLSLEDGALVEPMAVGLHGVRLAHIQHGSRVLIIGAGPIALSALFFSIRAGAARVAVVASSNRRREWALGLGAHAFILQGDGLRQNVEDALGGRPDVVIEAAGVPGVIEQGLQLVRPLGTVVSLGFCTVPDTFLPALAMMKEIRLQFSMTYDLSDFQTCVDTFSAGHVEPRIMITDRVSLDQFPATLESLRGHNSHGKIMVEPQR